MSGAPNMLPNGAGTPRQGARSGQATGTRKSTRAKKEPVRFVAVDASAGGGRVAAAAAPLRCFFASRAAAKRPRRRPLSSIGLCVAHPVTAAGAAGSARQCCGTDGWGCGVGAAAMTASAAREWELLGGSLHVGDTARAR
jgi:hypothetical protein